MMFSAVIDAVFYLYLQLQSHLVILWHLCDTKWCLIYWCAISHLGVRSPKLMVLCAYWVFWQRQSWNCWIYLSDVGVCARSVVLEYKNCSGIKPTFEATGHLKVLILLNS